MVAQSLLLQQMQASCGLFGTPYNGDECPACKGQREGAKRIIEERLRKDGKEKDRLISDVAERKALR